MSVTSLTTYQALQGPCCVCFLHKSFINPNQHSFHCNIFVFSSLVEGNTLNPHWSGCRHILTFCTGSYLAQRRIAAGEDPNKKTDSEHNFKSPDLDQPKTYGLLQQATWLSLSCLGMLGCISARRFVYSCVFGCVFVCICVVSC